MITSIPQIQTSDRVVSQLQQNIIQPVNDLLKNPVVQGSLLPNVALAAGNNIVPHGLGRAAQGWAIVDIDEAATIYRTAPLNAQTLALNASVACTVSIYVF